jgi:hypothetical protein
VGRVGRVLEPTQGFSFLDKILVYQNRILLWFSFLTKIHQEGTLRPNPIATVPLSSLGWSTKSLSFISKKTDSNLAEVSGEEKDFLCPQVFFRREEFLLAVDATR